MNLCVKGDKDKFTHPVVGHDVSPKLLKVQRMR